MSVEGVAEAAATHLPADTAGDDGADSGDVREDAREFMRKLAADEPEDEQAEPAPGAKAAKPESESDDEDEDAESTEPVEAKDDDAEADADEQAKPKKPTGYQKVKAARDKAYAELDEVRAKVDEFKERDSQWEYVAKTLEDRTKDAAAEIEHLRAQLSQYGVQDDPRDRRIAELERSAREREANLEREQAEAEARSQRAHAAEVERLKRQYIDNIRSIAASNNIEDRRLAAEFQARVSVAKATGQAQPTLEQVAESLAEMDRWRAGQQVAAQAQTSRGAPRVIRAAGSSVPDYGADTEGALAYLKSQGLM